MMKWPALKVILGKLSEIFFKQHCLFGLVFLLIIMGPRNPGLWQDAFPFAEEGGIFITHALRGDLFYTYAGYFHLLPSLYWFLAVHYWLDWAPHIAVILNLFLCTLVAWYLLLPHWKIIASFKIRFFVALAWIAFNPHTEIYLGLLESYLTLTFGVVLIVLELFYFPEDIINRYRIPKYFFLFFAVSSSPAPFIVICLILISHFLLASGKNFKERWVATRKIALTPRLIVVYLVGLIQVFLVLTTPAVAANGEPIAGFLGLPWALFTFQGMRVVSPWFLKGTFLTQVNQSVPEAMITCLISALLTIWIWFRTRNPLQGKPSPARILILTYLGFSVSIFVSRPTWYNHFIERLHHFTFGADRYSVMPSALWLLALMIALENTQKRAWAMLTMVAVTFVGVSHYRYPVYGKPGNWKMHSPQISAYLAGKIDKIDIPVYPDHFRIFAERERQTP